jgi:hypothetical protein
MNLDETTELDWNWRQWLLSYTRSSATVHYANLTRGVACAPKNAKLCRIQSTQCEAKAWDRVLMSVPDELIAGVALGQFTVVHDFSERPRETRAMWQGLTLVRIMMELRWWGELRGRYSGRGVARDSGLQYLRNVASSQPKHVKHRYDYFRDLTHVNNTTYLGLVSCTTGGDGVKCQYSGRTTPTRSTDQPSSTVW